MLRNRFLKKQHVYKVGPFYICLGLYKSPRYKVVLYVNEKDS